MSLISLLMHSCFFCLDMKPPNENRQYAMRGILMTRQLIMIDWEDERPVSSLPLYYPPCISPRMNLVDVLQLLQKGGSHIAFVCAGKLSFRQILLIRN